MGNNPELASQEEFVFNTKKFPVDEPPTVVEVSMGLTINLGNYESARLDVGIRIPCPAEESEAIFDKAKDWCEERVQTEVRAIRGKADS